MIGNDSAIALGMIGGWAKYAEQFFRERVEVAQGGEVIITGETDWIIKALGRIQEGLSLVLSEEGVDHDVLQRYTSEEALVQYGVEAAFADNPREWRVINGGLSD